MAFAAGIFADRYFNMAFTEIFKHKNTPGKNYKQQAAVFCHSSCSNCAANIFVFVRYGGAFNYANSINFESAERLKSTFLNEAVLDDGQTFYRVYKTYKEQQKITDVNITAKNFAKKSLFSAAIRRQIILKMLLSERLTSLNLQISRKM